MMLGLFCLIYFTLKLCAENKKLKMLIEEGKVLKEKIKEMNK